MRPMETSWRASWIRESGREQVQPTGRIHGHLACIDDIIVDDEPSEAALTHVPTGRDALVILAFTKNNPYSFRLSEERTVLTEHTTNTSDIIAAFDAEGQILQFNYRILKKNFSKEDKEMHETKVTEFADHFSLHTSMPTTQTRTNQRRSHPSRPESDGVLRIKMKKKRKWNLRKREPSSRRSAWSCTIRTIYHDSSRQPRKSLCTKP